MELRGLSSDRCGSVCPFPEGTVLGHSDLESRQQKPVPTAAGCHSQLPRPHKSHRDSDCSFRMEVGS